MKQLNSDIKNNSFRQVYLLTGDETFLKRSFKKRFKNAIAEDDMNYSYFEGKDTDIHEVIDTADTMPFFAERKLIVIENSGWLKAGGNDMADYLDRANPSSYLLFLENDVDKRSRLYKKISEIGYVCELKHPEVRDLSAWAAGILQQSGKKITRTDMEIFLSYTGNDMELVRNELEKLICYTGEREIISREDIEAITTVTATNKVYEMCRAITQRQTAEAMRLYEDLLALREPPMGILYKIARQFNQLLRVKDLVLAGYRQETVAAELHITGYIAGKLIRQVRSYDRNMLRNYVENCLELEEAIKTGDMPDRLAVELVICS